MRVEFRVFKPVEEYEVFITGFAGIGIVGHLATKYIAKNCEVVGVVRYRGEPAHSLNRRRKVAVAK